ncbi:MAG: PEP-CTERM sorting domain-containing protein [Verrucomicrobia bacterium]|nr:PEP-CTERM sorting domain-containing protein [Verrucomicrobiota bacterium]
MKQYCKNWKQTLACVALIAIVPFSSIEASIVYSEDFEVGGTGNQPLSNAGWVAYVRDDGQLFTGQGTPGFDAGNGNVAIGNDPEQGQFVFWWPGNSGDTLDRALVVLESSASNYPTGLHTDSLASISWMERTNVEESQWSLALQIDDGNWYVQNRAHDSTTTWSEEIFNFTPTASAWSDLNFIAGTSLNVGSELTNPLPSGQITAFGLYGEGIYDGSNGQTQRFDDFTVAIPEPGTLVLLGFAFGTLMIFRRRNIYNL